MAEMAFQMSFLGAEAFQQSLRWKLDGGVEEILNFLKNDRFF